MLNFIWHVPFLSMKTGKKTVRLPSIGRSTLASVNGQAYCPTGLTERQLQKWLIRSYMGFYLRPQKLFSLMKTLRSAEDVLRIARGVRQVSSHLSPMIFSSAESRHDPAFDSCLYQRARAGDIRSKTRFAKVLENHLGFVMTIKENGINKILKDGRDIQMKSGAFTILLQEALLSQTLMETVGRMFILPRCLQTRLFLNEGGRQFIQASDWIPERPSAALELPTSSVGGAAADYDNDGDQDLFLLTVHGPDLLLRNEGGFFTDQTTSAGLSVDNQDSGAAVWADYDLDGDLDLFVGAHLEALFSFSESDDGYAYQSRGPIIFIETTEGFYRG